MARAARSLHARKKRRKVLEQAKGYRGTKHSSYKRAKEQVWKSGVYAYQGRKQRKRDFRALWIQRINAGVREHGLSYSQFIHGLRLAEIDLPEATVPARTAIAAWNGDRLTLWDKTQFVDGVANEIAAVFVVIDK